MRTVCMFSATVSLAQICVGWAPLQAERREQSDESITQEGTDAQGLILLQRLRDPKLSEENGPFGSFQLESGKDSEKWKDECRHPRWF